MVSPDEKIWRAKDDMRTLSQAEEIRADKARHSAAQKMIEEEQKKLAAAASAAPKAHTGEEPKKGKRKESMREFVAKRSKAGK